MRLLYNMAAMAARNADAAEMPPNGEPTQPVIAPDQQEEFAGTEEANVPEAEQVAEDATEEA